MGPCSGTRKSELRSSSPWKLVRIVLPGGSQDFEVYPENRTRLESELLKSAWGYSRPAEQVDGEGDAQISMVSEPAPFRLPEQDSLCCSPKEGQLKHGFILCPDMLKLCKYAR
ncbi:MAG: hypothetical protein P8175_12625 [Deltaproteobacteria bacterium]